MRVMLRPVKNSKDELMSFWHVLQSEQNTEFSWRQNSLESSRKVGADARTGLRKPQGRGQQQTLEDGNPVKSTDPLNADAV